MGVAEDWIDGVEFPATKLVLIESADEAGVEQDLIERLQALDQEQYESRDELVAELRGAQS